MKNKIQINKELDLVLEREIDVPRELVWEAWTTPAHIKEWFCPKPWKVTDCTIDLRPGGTFFTLMEGPEGQKIPNNGIFLEVIPGERMITTDALLPGYRPSENPFMTAIWSLESVGKKTLYTAIAMHRDAETRKQHEEMGFHHGWGTALDQLIALMKKKM